MTTPLNKMASGRNLLCRPRQGGRGSHEQKMPKKDFVLSQPILEGFVEAPMRAFSGVSHRSDLACEVPLDSGNRRSLWRRQYRRPSSFSEKCPAGHRQASRGTSKLLSDDNPGTARWPFDSRRHVGSKRRQTYRRLGAASFGQRTSKGFVCGHSFDQNRSLGVCLRPSRLSAQKSLPAGDFQKQNRFGFGDLGTGLLPFPKRAYGRHGHLVCLRSYSQSYPRGGLDFCRGLETKPLRFPQPNENRRPSSGQEADELQTGESLQEKTVPDRFPNRLASSSGASQTFYHPSRKRASFLCHQQARHDGIRNGGDLLPAFCDRNLSQGHQTAFGLWGNVYALLDRRPNTLDDSGDRLQPRRLVLEASIEKFPTEDSSFQKHHGL